MNKVEVISLIRQAKRFERPIKNLTSRILRALNKNNVSVEVYLADPLKMRFLNRKFRGKNKTANILSFEEPKNFISPPSKAKKIGEIYLLAKEAGASQKTRLLIHGLLHLFGYKHERKSDRMNMEKAEQKLFHKI